MKIQLSKAISVKDYTEAVECRIDMDEIALKRERYPILEKHPFIVTLKHEGKESVSVCFETEVVLGIPCSRCLREVPFHVLLKYEGKSDFLHPSEEDDLASCVEDKELDLDMLIFDEVVPQLPSRLLCKEDCKGLCPVCGTNLNEKECGCDRTVADPRMAAIRDIFKNFKEV